MNLILFDDDEVDSDLDYTDPRAVHIREILHLEKGDDFAAGIIGGPRGRARLNARGVSGWKWTFTALEDSPPLLPLTLILGCPRPPVARRLLKDMSSLGLREIRVSSTRKILSEQQTLAGGAVEGCTDRRGCSGGQYHDSGSQNRA